MLFDFEGTLVDFQWKLSEAVRETLAMLKTSGLPTERLRKKKYSTLLTEAMDLAHEIGRSAEEIRKKIDAIYDLYDEDALPRWNMRPGAKEFLQTLKGKNVKSALVSNVGRRTLEKALTKLDLEDLFEVTVTRNDVRRLKPNGEGIRLALRRLKAGKDRAVFVGDSLDDVGAAKDAGLKVLIILGGENPKAELLAANPDFLFRDFSELSSLFETHLQIMNRL